MIAGREKLAQLHPVWRDLVTEILEGLDAYGVSGTLWTVWRSPAEQQRRYAAGDSNAPPGASPHNVTLGRRAASLAFDFVVRQGENSAMQRALQDWWEQNGFVVIRGGVGPQKIPDPSHVEAPNWRYWATQGS